MAAHAQNSQLEEEALALAERLQSLLQDKFQPSSFDADTPIDKALTFLQSYIQVMRCKAH